MGSGLRTLGAVLVAAILLGGAAAVQASRERRFPAPPPSEDSLYLTSGTAVRRLTVGYSALAADLYWIRAIQYYGGVKLRLQQEPPPAPRPGDAPIEAFPLLYPLLDLTTSLDPRFNIAYRFGSIFLA